jgi:hypothetical protein
MLNKRAKKSNNQTIYTQNGLRAGQVRGDTFHKNLVESRHMLWEPRAWSSDTSILKELKQRGVSTVSIYARDTGKTYVASLSDFWENGIEINRKYGDQICLTLPFWKVSSRENPVKQPIKTKRVKEHSKQYQMSI